MIGMPGRSFRGPLPPLAPSEEELAAALRDDVGELAGRIGERNFREHRALERASDWLEARLRATGLAFARQTYRVGAAPFHNLELELRGAARPDDVVVVGAHYDSVIGCPGANDNGTGTAALLALARALAADRPARTLRFVAFTNEEPPHFQTPDMGSFVYARRCRERGEKVAAMLSLETIGCYSDREGTQSYPPPVSFFYPSRGNFIAFVADRGSRALVRRVVRLFRERVSFPSEGASLPSWITGVGWSDQWSFWRHGYPGVMVTDTAPFRYPHYHTPDDTPDKIDYACTARVVAGLAGVVRALAAAE
jgi:hypothetical protein